MFVNREKELQLLCFAYESLKQGDRINVAVIGPRRIGKTELLLKFKENTKGIIPYLNLQRIGNEESFIFAYTRELIYEIYKFSGKFIEKSDLITWDDLLIASSKIGIEKEIKAIKSENKIDVLFEMQELALDKIRSKAVIILDEFQEVMHFKRFLETMRSITEKQENVAYFISGSAIRMMEEILSPKNPFFGQFRKIYLKGLPKEDTIKLAESLLKKKEIKITNSALNLIYDLTQGHPFYVISLCRRIFEDGWEKVNRRNLYYSFLTEVLTEKGDIYMHLDYVFNESLSRAYRGAVHRQILLILAQEEGLTLTQISNKLKKKTGEVSNYLKFLLKTDLIVRKNDRYYFRDKLMRFWLAKTYLGINAADLKREKLLEELIAELQEKYMKIKRELGLASEALVREKIRETLGIDFKPYRRGDTEFDGVVFNKKIHVLEIKWKNKPTTYRDVVHFIKKVELEFGNNVQMYFFSKNGFTEAAKKLCEKMNIQTFDWNDLF